MTITTKIFALLRAFFAEAALDEALKNSITEQDLQTIFKLAKKHDLAHIVGDVLDKSGLLKEDSQARKFFLQERNMAVFRYEQINYEYNEILRLLNEIGVEHIPLKGAVIRKFYPEPWVRTSCDIDILVREEDIEKSTCALMKELGYDYNGKGSHDAQLYSPGGVHLELHFSLLEDHLGKNTADILNDVWSYATPIADDSKTFIMTNEIFYFYHFAHMAKHFEAGGCGIKPFMDLFIMERAMRSDEEKLSDLLTQGGLLAFANATRALSKVWFEEAEHTATTLALEEYILTGGVYGTLDNKVKAQQTKKGGKFKYMFSRIFLPYELLCLNYPILKKRKWLTPCYQVVRWCRVLFKGSANKSMRELNTSANMSKETQDKTQALLKDLGLM